MYIYSEAAAAAAEARAAAGGSEAEGGVRVGMAPADLKAEALRRCGGSSL